MANKTTQLGTETKVDLVALKAKLKKLVAKGVSIDSIRASLNQSELFALAVADKVLEQR